MKIYDTLVVGTGATGGMAAKVLTEHGLEVLLLESGMAVKASQFKTHAMPYHSLPRLLCRIQPASVRHAC